MIYVLGSGGGASLNFSVVGGTTQPTGKENLIWVDTDTAITSWVFSATQPTSPVAGMVWFQTSTSASAPINVVKKNGIWIYPAGAYQYVGGEWVNKTAKTYQNGAWVDWRFYPLKEMVWKADGWRTTGERGEIAFTDTTITLRTYAYHQYAGVVTTERLNVTRFNKIWWTQTNIDGSPEYNVALTNNNNNQSGQPANVVRSVGYRNNGVYSLDIRDISGEYYIAVGGVNAEGRTGKATISDFYFE